MRVLSLVSPEKSDIKYSVIKFSDTQILLNLSEEYQRFGFTFDEKEPIQISSRMSWNDLQYIISAVVALRNYGVKKIHLYCPYFLGARSDRSFQKGGVNYLKQVICPILNSLNLESIITMDPHSHCLEMGITNFKPLTNFTFVEWALSELLNNYKVTRKEMIWIIPDKGASDKAKETIKATCLKHYYPTIIQCLKDRDIDTGKLLGYTIVEDPKFSGEDCVLVDDLTDGGGTFVPLAEEFKKRGAGRVFLISTHGIFSNRFIDLKKCIDQVYCTNSFQEEKDILQAARWCNYCQDFDSNKAGTERVHVLNVF